jgi:hypothetical protein
MITYASTATTAHDESFFLKRILNDVSFAAAGVIGFVTERGYTRFYSLTQKGKYYDFKDFCKRI